MENKNITYYIQHITTSGQCILVCDVGGTNTRCALVEVGENKQTFIFVLRVLTKDVIAFTDVISHALLIAREKYNITVTKAVCALAGCQVKNADIWVLPNVAWCVEKKEITQKTSLTDVLFLNDFEAIGYSLDALTDRDLVCLNSGTVSMHENKGIIGAGTDLGECIVAWNPISKSYVVAPSEGGLADFPPYDQEELSLINFLQNKFNSRIPIRLGTLLSGRGISNMYQFFEQRGTYALTGYSLIIKNHNYDPAIIAQYKDVDACCKKTFEVFSAFYGRAAKNFALGARAYGGVYLAGGIAAKNTDIFSNGIFTAEFFNTQYYKDLLAQTPIFIIKNQDAGLLGAAQFADLQFSSGRT